MGIAWNVFKAYIRGILISFKVHREKDRALVRTILIDKIQKLEELNKAVVEPTRSEHLKEAYDKLKILMIVQELIYAKQRILDYL